MIRLHDTAIGEVRELEPRVPGTVSVYVCGPTPYDVAHVGHGRMLLVYDVLRRYLEWTGLTVRFVSNVTDIEDKIIARAQRDGTDPEDVVARYEQEWFALSARLGVRHPDAVPHATEYVERIVDYIAGLVDRGHAYATTDGVYFEVASLDGYGALARQSLESLRAGARVEVVEQKRAPLDFALWKLAKPGEPHWPSPWGDGRPGWHIECTVMAVDLLGDEFDLHGAGLDLAFPHNENERAQALAGGRPFARHWMHHGMVETGGEKMSRSVGNVTGLAALLDETDPRAYRVLVLRSHYRSPMEVTPAALADAAASLARLDALARRIPPGGATAEEDVLDRFRQAMDDDLGTPAVAALLFETVRRANAAADAGDDVVAARAAAGVREICAAVGLELRAGADAVDDAAAALATRRDEARRARDFATADALRAELEASGWVVEDGAAGTVLRRA